MPVSHPRATTERAEQGAASLGLRSRQAQLARDAALDAVVDLLENGDLDGVDDVAMPDVARTAGVSLRTLYRYFPTRDALLREAGARMQTRLALPIEIDGPDDIPSSFWSASARLAEHPKLARALVRTETGRAAHGRTRSARVDAIHAALGPLTDELPADQARQIAGVITHLCSSIAWVSISDESQLSTDDARAGVKWALTVLLDAIRAEASPPKSPASRRKKR